MIILSRLLGSLFGIGFSPFAPGTLGSIFACLTYIFFFSRIEIYVFVFIILLMLGLGIYLGTAAEKSGRHDPQWFVLDEWVGQSIPLIIIAGHDFAMIAVSCIVFRFFDIAKIGYINKLQNLSGGFGIMLDDVLAGIYSLIIVWGVQWFMS